MLEVRYLRLLPASLYCKSTFANYGIVVGVSVGVSVNVGVAVTVDVGVFVTVAVNVGVNVMVGDPVGVGERDGVNVAVGGLLLRRVMRGVIHRAKSS